MALPRVQVHCVPNGTNHSFHLRPCLIFVRNEYRGGQDGGFMVDEWWLTFVRSGDQLSACDLRTTIYRFDTVHFRSYPGTKRSIDLFQPVQQFCFEFFRPLDAPFVEQFNSTLEQAHRFVFPRVYLCHGANDSVHINSTWAIVAV